MRHYALEGSGFSDDILDNNPTYWWLDTDSAQLQSISDWGMSPLALEQIVPVMTAGRGVLMALSPKVSGVQRKSGR